MYLNALVMNLLVAGLLLAVVPVLFYLYKSSKKIKIRTGYVVMGVLASIAILFGIPIIKPERPLIVKEIVAPKRDEIDEEFESTDAARGD
jgi:hypothetical protein